MAAITRNRNNNCNSSTIKDGDLYQTWPNMILGSRLIFTLATLDVNYRQNTNPNELPKQNTYFLDIYTNLIADIEWKEGSSFKKQIRVFFRNLVVVNFLLIFRHLTTENLRFTFHWTCGNYVYYFLKVSPSCMEWNTRKSSCVTARGVAPATLANQSMVLCRGEGKGVGVSCPGAPLSYAVGGGGSPVLS